jgi:malignant T-cell-amplified sequence
MRKTLSKKERNDFLLKNNFMNINEKEPLQYDEKEGIYYSGNNIVAINLDEAIIPYLKNKNNDLSNIPSVEVDMPAVPFMTKGADLLRPGIVRMDDFEEGNIIVVRDEKNKVALAIMKTNYSSGEIQMMERGKVAKSLHYVNDKYWKNN